MLCVANVRVVVVLVAAGEKGETSLFAKESVENVCRVVRLKCFEKLDLGVGLVGGGGGGCELDFVVDFDFEVRVRLL